MILVCGEALVDLVPVPVGGEAAYLPRAGGSPYNVAVGLVRLGQEVAFLGRFSHDRFGRLLRDRLTANAVRLLGPPDGGGPTALAVVHLEPGGEPEFAFYGEGTADRSLAPSDLPAALPEGTAALHFGSISLVREPGASAFEELMRREAGRRVISLDPNVRPGLIADRAAYLRRLAGWLALADVVKVSRADLGWIQPGEEPEAVARAWLAAGPALVAVTRGAEGAIAFTATDRVAVPGIRVPVADTVGAGDAFTAGLLAGLAEDGRLDRSRLGELSEAVLEACLGFANAAAALTCTRPGAEPPTREEVAAFASRDGETAPRAARRATGPASPGPS